MIELPFTVRHHHALSHSSLAIFCLPAFFVTNCAELRFSGPSIKETTLVGLVGSKSSYEGAGCKVATYLST